MKTEEKKKLLSPKQLALLNGLLAGKTYMDALSGAGYSENSRASVMTVKRLYNEILEEKQKQIAESSISKEECIATLKTILNMNKDDNTRIKAMALISKIMGFDAPTKVETTGSQHVTLRFSEDTEDKNG